MGGNDDAFIEKYLAETPGYYTSGDAGIFDENGYFHIMTRTDDVINTAGHRISTGRLEEAVNDHEDVIESAVIGFNDPLKGEVPVAFCVVRSDLVLDDETRAALQKDVEISIREKVGAFAKLEGCMFVNKMPKT